MLLRTLLLCLLLAFRAGAQELPPEWREGRFAWRASQPLDHREVWATRERAFDWVVTNKFPLWGAGGKVVGVMGTVRSLQEKQEMIFSNARISPAVRHIQEHFARKLDMRELGRLASLGERQLRRQFREAFGMGPQEFLLTTRLQMACKALRESVAPISEIAHTTGFSDQSSFTLHFRRNLGITPLQFRRTEASR